MPCCQPCSLCTCISSSVPDSLMQAFKWWLASASHLGTVRPSMDHKTTKYWNPAPHPVLSRYRDRPRVCPYKIRSPLHKHASYSWWLPALLTSILSHLGEEGTKLTDMHFFCVFKAPVLGTRDEHKHRAHSHAHYFLLRACLQSSRKPSNGAGWTVCLTILPGWSVQWNRGVSWVWSGVEENPSPRQSPPGIQTQCRDSHLFSQWMRVSYQNDQLPSVRGSVDCERWPCIRRPSWAERGASQPVCEHSATCVQLLLCGYL